MKEHYTLLLVDDEDEVRGRISSLIDQNSGFVIVGKAGNGHDAYELVEELHPDVVLTDIKMPFIDGIELAKLLKRDFPTVKVAFISGYDEFKYAQEAIKLNVISYLMKPITSQEINQFLKDLKNRLDDEYSRKFNNDIALKHYQDSLPLVVNHLINNLLISEEDAKEPIQRLKQYGMRIDDGPYLVALMDIEYTDEVVELIALEKLKVLVNELMESTFSTHVLKHNQLVQGGILILLKAQNDSLLREMDAFLYELLQTAEQYMGMRVRVGVSSLFTDFAYLSTAYQESKKALRYGKLLNTGRIVYITEAENRETKRVVLDPDDIKLIENAARFGSNDELHNLLYQRLEKLKSQPDVILNHDLLVISLANILLNFAQSISADTDDIIGHSLVERMMEHQDLDCLFEWTETTLMQLRKRYIDSSRSRTDEILEKAIHYVDEHYADSDLSLNVVCDYLDISISYLSMLLKRQKNLSFNKYVVQVRMEKAKELLRTTNLKIIDISLSCGYNEVYYFSHSFKKHTKMTPKQYREAFYEK